MNKRKKRKRESNPDRDELEKLELEASLKLLLQEVQVSRSVLRPLRLDEKIVKEARRRAKNRSIDYLV